MASVDTLPLTGEDLRVLARIAMMAAQTPLAVDALRMFELLQAVQPDTLAFWVGRANALVTMGYTEEAHALLRDGALRAHPDDGNLKIVFATVLHQCDRPREAEALLAELIRTGPAGALYVANARKLLAAAGWIESARSGKAPPRVPPRMI